MNVGRESTAIRLAVFCSNVYRMARSNYREDLPPSDWAEPVALVVSDGRQAYSAAVLNALFAVPQLRDALKQGQCPHDKNHPRAHRECY
jgi:hypothetical protein